MRLMAVLLLIWVVPGCQHTNGTPVDLTVLWQSSQCRIQQPGIRLMNNLGDIRQVTAGQGLTPQSTIPQPDFTRQAVVLLAMGQQPTAGYRIAMEGPGRLDPLGRELWVPVRFISPGNDMLVAAVLTSPCMIFAVSQSGVDRIIAGTTGLSVELK